MNHPPRIAGFLLGMALAATARADCLESEAIAFLKIPRDTVGLHDIGQLLGVTEILDKLCPGHSIGERAAAVENALSGLCDDWPCVKPALRKKQEPGS
jgi:hypothetical protein